MSNELRKKTVGKFADLLSVSCGCDEIDLDRIIFGSMSCVDLINIIISNCTKEYIHRHLQLQGLVHEMESTDVLPGVLVLALQLRMITALCSLSESVERP